jgi:predicted nucleic acid-binding protein
MSLVLDASVALAWCFEDEATPQSAGLLDRVDREAAIVPGIWSLELANILALAERRGRITEADIVEFVTLLDRLDIRVDGATAERGLNEVLALARAEKLTSYDAAYLDLAMREGLPLATRDNDLIRAARRLGVKIVPA